MEPLPPLPTFLILGAQKSATRWLRENLGEHPEVFATPLELSYFNQRYDCGPTFYRSQFAGWDGEPIVGESTPGYLMPRYDTKLIADRIAETVPDVRLLALLRDPIDRAQSALVHHKLRERLPQRMTLVEAVERCPIDDDPLGLVAGGRYAANLAPFVERFGDQLLVLLHEDVRDAPLDVYRRASEHVGASPGFVPPSIDRVVYSNQPDRPSGRAVPDEVRQRLWPLFEADVKELETLIDRDLAAWDPTRSP